MNKVKLKDVCEAMASNIAQKDISVGNGDYPIYGASGFIGNVDFYKQEKPYIGIVKDGAGVGRAYLLPEKSSVIGTMQYILPKDNIDIKYLYYAIQYMHLEKYYSGATIPHIYFRDYQYEPILLPGKKEQEQKTNGLEKIDKLVFKHKKTLRIIDTLVKSRFIEMFGDPVTNPMGWKVTTVGQVTTDVRYGTSAKANDDGQYKYLRMNNLTYDGYLDLSDLKHIDVSDDELEKCVVRKGDVLFNRTNSTELVGKTALFDLDEDMVIAGYIIRVRLHEFVSPVFFTRFMNMEFMKKQLRSMAKGAVNQANINAQELKAIAMYVPPIELQNEFADFVEQVDKSKFAVQQSINTLQTLKAKLMQAYFK